MWFSAKCVICRVSNSALSADKASAAWNRRATPPAPAPDGWEPTPEMVEAARSVVRQVLVDADHEVREDKALGALKSLDDNDDNDCWSWWYLRQCPPPAPAPDGWEVAGFRYRYEPQLQWHLVEFENELPRREGFAQLEIQKVYAPAPAAPTED